MKQRGLLIWVLVCIIIVFALWMGAINPLTMGIYDWRNTYLPNFSYSYDDYIIYIPIVVMFGLAIANVKSYSGWKRMLVLAIFSFALMLIIVNILKSITGILRPDGSDFYSFPSGHTAAAFTASTLLYKEYGYRVKWTSVFIYLTAVAVGVTRMLNNRHWLSDVLAGALIGITSVLIIYYFANLMKVRKQPKQ